MEYAENSKRCKWTRPATNLLISVWSHDLVQKQLKSSTRNQPIWESIARFMTRKGYPVTGLQCRTRIKNMLCIYQEAIKKNEPSEMMPYFCIFKEVLDKKGLKEQKSLKIVKPNYSKETDEEENESSKDSNSFDVETSRPYNRFEVEFSEDANNDNDAQYYFKVNIKNEIKEMENAIVKAIDSQTTAIIKAIELQSQMIERLITADREKWECILKLERENRKGLKKHLE